MASGDHAVNRILTLIPLCGISMHSLAQIKDIHSPGIYITHQQVLTEVPHIIPQAWVYGKNWYAEGRSNYEGAGTFSLYGGYPLMPNKHRNLEFIPILGAVVGKANGLSAGYTALMEYKHLTVSSQGQYTSIGNQSFLWQWSSCTIPLRNGFGVGASLQLYAPLYGYAVCNLAPKVSCSSGGFTIEAFAYNLWEAKPLFAVGVEFVGR